MVEELAVNYLGAWATCSPPAVPPHHTRLSGCSGGPTLPRKASIQSNPTWGPYRAPPHGGESSTGRLRRRGRGAAVLRCDAAVRHTFTHSRTRSHTHTHVSYLRFGRHGEATYLPRGVPEKNGQHFPLRRGENAASRRSPGAPRKIGQHFPLITKGNAPITRGHSRENAPRKIGQHFPLREGVKKPVFPALPGGTLQKILQHFPLSSTEARRRSTVSGVGTWPPHCTY